MVVLTKKGISVTLTGSPTVSTTRDGNFIVHVGATGTATIESVTPAQTGSGSTLRNGASWNLPGSAETFPFDGRQSTYQNYSATHQLTYPKTAVAGDVAIFSKSHGVWNPATLPGGLYARTNYWPTGDGARSDVDEMLIIIFVAYAQTANHMRGFGLGNSVATRWLRANVSIVESQVNVAGLPSTINLTAVANPLATTYFTAANTGVFSDFCGDVASSWGGDVIAPSEQHPGYARNLQALVSQAMCIMCSTRTTGEKTPLAIMLTQWGLDLAGAWLDGRFTSAQNGHGQGRKALICFAGHMLGIPQLTDPQAALGAANKFQETDSFQAFTTPGTQWFFDSPVWLYKWKAKEDVATYGEFWQYMPATWSTNDVYWTVNYMEHMCGAFVGTVLAMQLLGLRTQFGEAPMSFVAYWMDGPGATPIANMTAAHPSMANVSWGDDFSIGGGADMCKESWTNHWPL